MRQQRIQDPFTIHQEQTVLKIMAALLCNSEQANEIGQEINPAKGLKIVKHIYQWLSLVRL